VTKIQADLPEMISVRLPKSVISQIDDLAEKRDSSRTSVIRSAITTYFRLRDSILVPISTEHRQRLFELSQQNKMPFDLFSEILMARAIENETLEVEWNMNTPRKSIMAQKNGFLRMLQSEKGVKYAKVS
jgi:Arc/MetJ-type ribon-helix-helix transcriptional regulator